MPTQEEIARGAKSGRKQPKKSRLSTALGGTDVDRNLVHWGEVDPSGIVAITTQVSALGGAVLFGGSRDRGALQLTVHLEGDKAVFWFSSAADAESEMADLYEKLNKLM